MSSMTRLHLLVLLIFSLSQARMVQAVDTAYFTLENSNPLIGEPVQVTLHITVPQNAQVSLPDFAAEWSGITVAEVGNLNIVNQSDDATTEYMLFLTIILWQTGSVATPPLNLSYQIADAAPVMLPIESIQFAVPSTLGTDDISLRPSKPQISVFYFPRWIVVVLPMLILAMGLFGLIHRPLWFLLPMAAKSNIDSISTSNVSGILKKLKQVSESETRPALIYQQVSDYLRAYLNAYLVLHSLDLTTNELMAQLKNVSGLSDSQHRQLNEMLKFADRVKFSQVSPEIKAGQQFALVAAEWIRSVEEKSV